MAHDGGGSSPMLVQRLPTLGPPFSSPADVDPPAQGLPAWDSASSVAGGGGCATTLAPASWDAAAAVALGPDGRGGGACEGEGWEGEEPEAPAADGAASCAGEVRTHGLEMELPEGRGGEGEGAAGADAREAAGGGGVGGAARD